MTPEQEKRLEQVRKNRTVNVSAGWTDDDDGVDFLLAMVGTLRTQVEGLREALCRLEKQTADANLLPDHACAECVPGGEIVIQGFRCGRHTARAILGTPSKTEET